MKVACLDDCDDVRAHGFLGVEDASTDGAAVRTAGGRTAETLLISGMGLICVTDRPRSVSAVLCYVRTSNDVSHSGQLVGLHLWATVGQWSDFHQIRVRRPQCRGFRRRATCSIIDTYSYVRQSRAAAAASLR